MPTEDSLVSGTDVWYEALVDPAHLPELDIRAANILTELEREEKP